MPAHVIRRAFSHQQAASVPALGPEIDDPVGGADDVQVVLDDDERMPRLQQLAEGPHELGDIVEVQPGGGLVEQEQRALLGHALGGRSGGFGQEARELQALGLAAGQRGHGLAQAHVVQAHVHQRLQPRHHLAVVAEQRGRLADGELQHIGHRELTRPAHDLHVQDLGTEAPAVAVRAAQVHVRQELHLHVLEARTPAGGAAPIASVEAEHAGGVAALGRQRRTREQLAHLVEGTHVAGRVAARRLADGRLVHEHRIGQPVGAQQLAMRPGRLGGLAEVARQGGVQHVLHQRALARARDPGHADQALQREGHGHVLQVVLGGLFQDQARRRGLHQALEAQTHLLARAEVLACQRIGAARRLWRAVEDDLPAALAWAGAHVDQPVGRQHHGRIVLHHHQGVAGVAQAVHGLHDAVHVARVQADAGLVQHEHGVHERGAQRRGQVDALHLATREGAALAVQRQVPETHVAQVLQPGADLIQQQLQGLVQHRGRQAQAIEETLQALDGQLHQVVQGQARQGVELRARPGHAHGQEAAVAACGGGQHRIRVGLRAQTPQQRLELQSRAAAVPTRGVAAVLGQEHADVHLVRLALQIAEEAAHAVPLPVPVALPARVALDHPVALRQRELAPGRVAGNAGIARVLHQVVLAFLPGGGLQGLDGAVAQSLAVVRDHEPEVHADDTTEATAGLAGAKGGVEAEQRRLRVGVAQVALGAVQTGGVAPDGGRCVSPRLGHHMHVQPPTAALERQLDGLHGAHLLHAGHAEAVGHHVQHLARALHTLRLHAGEAAGRQPLVLLLRRGVGGQFHREGQHQARVARGGGALQQVGVDGLGRVVPHRQRGLAVEQLAGAGEQQLQVIVQLGHRADRAAAGAHRVGLVDGNRRRHAVHAVHGRAVHAVQKLPGVGAEGLDVAALAFGIQRVEHQAGLARPAGAGDHRHLARADVEVQVLQVVLARAADADQPGGHR